MSIRVHLEQELSEEQRIFILNNLQFQSPTTHKWVYPYHVEGAYIYLPYAYARSTMHFKPPPRSSFPIMSVGFEGQLRPYQQTVKTECIALLKKQGCCVLSLHVGWGKSMFAVYLAARLKFKTLILVNRLVLVKQWTQLIASVCPTATFQFLKSGMVLDPATDFVLVNATNMYKFPMGTFAGVGTVIADEIHLICAHSLYKCLYYVTPRYLVGLSATPTRPDGLDFLIDTYFGTASIDKKLFRHHDVFCVHTGFEIGFELNFEGRIDWNSLLNAQAVHEERNDLIVQLVRKYPERYVLILCKRIAHGKELVRRLETHGEHVTHMLGTKHGFDEDARIVIATAQKAGVGFDHRKLNTLIMAADVQEYFIQYLGRVFRTPDSQPIVFDLVDSNSVLKRHFATRKRVYKQAGGCIRDVTDTDAFLTHIK